VKIGGRVRKEEIGREAIDETNLTLLVSGRVVADRAARATDALCHGRLKMQLACQWSRYAQKAPQKAFEMPLDCVIYEPFGH
jgi:hypothetical protein